MKPLLLDRMLLARKQRRSVARLVNLATGQEALVDEGQAHGDLVPTSLQMAETSQCLQDDRSGMLASSNGQIFVHVHSPPLRLLIIGAVHIAQPLVSMAVLTGYDVTVIDPRRAFATYDRFPGVSIVIEWPDEALATLAPDRRTAIITLTHDPKLDDPALFAAVSSSAFYIGALGSRKTHLQRVERLSAGGASPEMIGRVHAPVGLAIGALTPAEIAISILADMTQALRMHATQASG